MSASRIYGLLCGLVLFSTQTISSFVHAQPTHPFVDTTAVWFVESWVGSGGPENVHYDYSGGKFFFGKDTIVDSITYKTILGNGPDTSFINSSAYLKGFIREDSAGRVYIRGRDHGTSNGYCDEVLLYDFGMEIGDSIEYPIPLGFCDFPTPGKIYVENIDTIELNGQLRKRYWVRPQSSWVEQWIEGIGALDRYTLNPLSSRFESNTRLACYYNKDIYLNFIGKSCSFTGIKKQHNFETIDIYPNPVQTGLRISGLSEDVNYRIYNTHGSCVGSSEIKNQSEIDVSSLPNGIYLLQLIRYQKRMLDFKFMKE